MTDKIIKIGFGAVGLLMGYDIIRRHQKNHHDEVMADNDNRVLDAISRLEKRVDAKLAEENEDD